MATKDKAVLYKELGKRFSESSYEVKEEGSNKRWKSEVLTWIKAQKTDHAIIEYDASNPLFSMWYAQYLSELGRGTNTVSEIILIGNHSDETVNKLRGLYEQTEITIINKSLDELAYEDLYCRHTLVFHNLGEVFLRDKVPFKKIDDIYSVVPKRPKLERLAKLIRRTRFIYNTIVYVSDGKPDFSWQMQEIYKAFDADTKEINRGESSERHLDIIGNFRLSSITWKDGHKMYYKPELTFRDKEMPNCKYILWFGQPLKDSEYLVGLSHEELPTDDYDKSGLYADEKKKGVITELTPYGVASDFNIWKLTVLYQEDRPLCDDIIHRYEIAAKDGIKEAYNNLAVFYTRIENMENAFRYYQIAIDGGSERAAVNYISVADTYDKEIDPANIIEKINESNDQLGTWIKAIRKWKEGSYREAIYFFEKLSKIKDDYFSIDGIDISQLAINNLIKINLEGKNEAEIEPNAFLFQKYLGLAKLKDNEELLAVCLAKGYITSGNEQKDKETAFQLFSKLYDKEPNSEIKVKNLIFCYAEGIGCERDIQKAIEICEKFLSENKNDEIRYLLGDLYDDIDDTESCLKNWEMTDLSYARQTNYAIRLSKVDQNKARELCLKLAKEPACETCHEARNYNEILRICPKIQDELGDYFMQDGYEEKAEAFYSRAANWGWSRSYGELGKLYYHRDDKAKAETFFRKSLYSGRKFPIPFLIEILYPKQKTEALRLMLLQDSISGGKNGIYAYYIYKILSTRIISSIKKEEYNWLKKSADAGYNQALVAYADYLISQDDKITALDYLQRFKGDDETVKEKTEKLAKEVEEQLKKEAYEDDEYAYDDGYYEETDYERDTWDAMTDGMYGDYPGSGVDYEALGF